MVKVNNKVKQLIYKQIYKYAEIYKSWPSSTLHVIKFAFQEFQNRIYCRCKTAKILSSAFWNVSNYWPIRHKMALCQYSELVGGPCGLSLENRSSTQCVTIGECDKNVKVHLNHYKCGTLAWIQRKSFCWHEQVILIILLHVRTIRNRAHLV